MEKRGIAGFIPTHRRFMRLNLRLKDTRQQQGPEGSELVVELKAAGERMVRIIQEAQGQGLNFHDFYADACRAIGEHDTFVLLDWEEEDQLLLGVRLQELEWSIQEAENKQIAKQTGMEVFFGSMATQDAFTREISEDFKRHAHILWQLVGKRIGFMEIITLRNQAMQMSAEEIAALRGER